MGMATIMTIEGAIPSPPWGEGALLRLLAWLSPSFPIGGYTYSHGIEQAVETGFVRDRASLTEWVAFILEHGAGRPDAVLFAAAHRAVESGDEPAFLWALERADAMRGSKETALESSAQGTAFLSAVTAAWPLPGPWQAIQDSDAKMLAAQSEALIARLDAASDALRAAMAASISEVSRKKISSSASNDPLSTSRRPNSSANLRRVGQPAPM